MQDQAGPSAEGGKEKVQKLLYTYISSHATTILTITNIQVE